MGCGSSKVDLLDDSLGHVPRPQANGYSAVEQAPVASPPSANNLTATTAAAQPSSSVYPLHETIRGAYQDPNASYIKIEEQLDGGANVNAVDASGCTALHRAAELGNESIVEQVLQRGARLNAVIPSTLDTPLHLAARLGHEEVVRSLLSWGGGSTATNLGTGADPNSRNALGHTPLVEATLNAAGEGTIRALLHGGADPNAVVTGHGTVLHILVRTPGMEDPTREAVYRGGQVTARDPRGDTPLHVAARLGKLQLVEYFLKEPGGAVEIRNAMGQTPAQVAAEAGHTEIAGRLSGMVLLQAAFSGDVSNVMAALDSADLENSLGNGSNTAVHYAAERGHSNVLEQLISAGIPGVGTCISQSNDEGDTPLHLASKAGHDHALRCMLALPTSVSALAVKNADGLNALHIAAQEGHERIVSELLNVTPALINEAADGTGSTALHEAANRAHLQLVELLLARGADVNARNNFQETPLHLAASWGNTAVVDRLLECGADPLAVDVTGRTPQDTAQDSGHIELWEAMLGSRLRRAAAKGDVSGAQAALQEGAVVDFACDPGSGDTALHVAARCGHARVISTLLRHVNDPQQSVKLRNSDGETPLHVAAKAGECDAIVALLEGSGVDADVLDDNDDTPLLIAAVEGWVGALEVLVAGCADPDRRGLRGGAPLHDAACEGNIPVVETLLRLGADPNAQNAYDGNTPLHQVALWGRPGESAQVVTLLLGAGADPELRNNDGKTFRDLALVASHSSVLEILNPQAGVAANNTATTAAPKQDKLPAHWTRIDSNGGVSDVPSAPSAPTEEVIRTVHLSGTEVGEGLPPDVGADDGCGAAVSGLHVGPDIAESSQPLNIVQGPGRPIQAVRVAQAPTAVSPFAAPPELPTDSVDVSGRHRTAETASPRKSEARTSEVDVDDRLLIDPDRVHIEGGVGLGEGSFGKVFRGTFDGSKVAIKILHAFTDEGQIPDKARVLADFRRELMVMERMRHRNIQELRGYVLTEHGPGLVSEYYARGSLADIMKRALRNPERAAELPWMRRVRFTVDIAAGMLHMHSQRPRPIIHRDLKAINCFVDENWKVLVGDFGMTQILHDWSKTLAASSGGGMLNPRWMAPELLTGQDLSAQMICTPKTDVFAFGCTMYEILTWRPPWYNVKPWEVINKVGQGHRPALPATLPGPDTPEFASRGGLHEYMALMERCWAQNPEDRPSFKEIHAAVQTLLNKFDDNNERY